MAARAHMSQFHPERDGVFDMPHMRRWRPWLRCTLLAGAALLLLAGITAAAVTLDMRGWLR